MLCKVVIRYFNLIECDNQTHHAYEFVYGEKNAIERVRQLKDTVNVCEVFAYSMDTGEVVAE